MIGDLVEGVVVEKSSRKLKVSVEGDVILCDIRGRLRELSVRGLPVVVGDRVRLRATGAREGVLEECLPRRTELRRARQVGARADGPWSRRGDARRGGGQEELVVAANVDQVIAVLAASLPAPRWGLVDRILVSAQIEGLEAAVGVNKWDEAAAGGAELLATVGEYRRLGYPVFTTSALTRSGLGEIIAWLAGKTTVLSGHSGVGKSTLLSALCPEVVAATGEVNRVTGRGRHVTTKASLHALRGGGFVVDTPGFREYGLIDVPPARLGTYYREFLPHLAKCRFNDCLHLDEPGCAVRQGLERGEIGRSRFAQYLQILASLRGG